MRVAVATVVSMVFLSAAGGLPGALVRTHVEGPPSEGRPLCRDVRRDVSPFPLSRGLLASFERPQICVRLFTVQSKKFPRVFSWVAPELSKVFLKSYNGDGVALPQLVVCEPLNAGVCPRLSWLPIDHLKPPSLGTVTPGLSHVEHVAVKSGLTALGDQGGKRETSKPGTGEFELARSSAVEPLTPAPAAQTGSPDCSDARRGVAWYRSRTWDYQARHDAPRTATGHAERSPGCAWVRAAARLWRARARESRRAFESWYRRTYEKWRCIHEREAAWNEDEPPHWGGLQMDMDFQAEYGPGFLRRWGTADRWPVWAQLLAAERAYRTRGFYPWPLTARACGLI